MSNEEVSKEMIAQALLDEYNSWEGCTDIRVLSNVHETLYSISERLNLIEVVDFSPPVSPMIIKKETMTDKRVEIERSDEQLMRRVCINPSHIHANDLPGEVIRMTACIFEESNE